MSQPGQEPQSPPALPQAALAPEATRTETRLSEQNDKVLPEAVLTRTDQVLAATPPAPPQKAKFEVRRPTVDSWPGLQRVCKKATDTQPGHVRISANEVAIEVEVEAEVPPAETGQWEVGFVQTVEFIRELWIEKSTGYFCYDTTLRPTRDGNVRTPEPWYDDRSMTTVNNPRDRLRIRFFDQPSFESAIVPGNQFVDFRGKDTYKTWLIAWKRGGPHSHIRYLRRWDWKIDWGGPSRQGRGVKRVTEGPGDSGDEAVLTGPLAPEEATETPLGPLDKPEFSDD